MKHIKVNKDNYKQYRYLGDYRNGALEALTDEELKAQKFHIKNIYRGMKGTMKVLQKIAENSIWHEMMKRKIR